MKILKLRTNIESEQRSAMGKYMQTGESTTDFPAYKKYLKLLN